ncbi:hypothetical protein M405DRAFT_643303 [Rhizopogon salebrosus TDB-379]|nr:hypothetical protein M405DRAFT_643303 [Rhizopogon salebrosus TDB-379]
MSGLLIFRSLARYPFVSHTATLIFLRFADCHCFIICITSGFGCSRIPLIMECRIGAAVFLDLRGQVFPHVTSSPTTLRYASQLIYGVFIMWSKVPN